MDHGSSINGCLILAEKKKEKEASLTGRSVRFAPVHPLTSHIRCHCMSAASTPMELRPLESVDP